MHAGDLKYAIREFFNSNYLFFFFFLMEKKWSNSQPRVAKKVDYVRQCLYQGSGALEYVFSLLGLIRNQESLTNKFDYDKPFACQRTTWQ